jgi:excisionase family DNA binding protein
MKEMPPSERARFFALLGESGFEKENFSHAEVFGEVINSAFTVGEATEYLEVSVSTFRRYVQGHHINPSQVVGRNQLFSAADLKSLEKIFTGREAPLIRSGKSLACPLVEFRFLMEQTE